MIKWQPIETAPKDETLILGFDPNADCPIYVIRWFSLNDETGPGYWIEAGGEEYESWNPTHWMPLPKPPGE